MKFPAAKLTSTLMLASLLQCPALAATPAEEISAAEAQFEQGVPRSVVLKRAGEDVWRANRK